MVSVSKTVFILTVLVSIVLWVAGMFMQNKLAVDPRTAAPVAKAIAMALATVLAFSAVPVLVDWFFKAQKQIGNLEAIPLLGRLDGQQNMIVFVIWGLWMMGLLFAFFISER